MAYILQMALYLAVLLASSMSLFQFAELLGRYGIKMPMGASSWLLALLSTIGYGYLGWYYEAWGQVALCALSTIIISLIIWKDGLTNARKVRELSLSLLWVARQGRR